MTNIRRNRPLILLAVLAWLCLPSSAMAKTIIGVIIPSTTPDLAEVQKTFRGDLKAEVPDSDIDIIVQHPFPDGIALGNATRKLAAVGADILITYGTSATMAALNEQTKLPLIYFGVYDPDNAPFAGRDLTGCGYKVPLTSLLRYLKELKSITTMCAIYSSLENDTVRQINELKDLAGEQKITLIPVNIKNGEELDLVQLGKGDALLITGGSIVTLRLPEILAFAQDHQQPSISVLPDLADTGVTISLFSPLPDQIKKTAQIVGLFMAGRSPREIKPETMRNTELVFNLRGAKNLGVRIPFQLVAEASKVIK